MDNKKGAKFYFKRINIDVLNRALFAEAYADTIALFLDSRSEITWNSIELFSRSIVLVSIGGHRVKRMKNDLNTIAAAI